MADKDYRTVIGSDAATFAGAAGSEADPDTLPVFLLKVVGGEQDGALFPLDWTQTSRALVGTSAGCTVQVRDPKVSRRHCALGPHGRHLRLTDLTSTNGTKVGSVRVMEALLRGGESISLGDTTLKVMRMGDAANPMLYSNEFFGRVLGRSAPMQRAFVIGSRIAQTQLPLLIEGETGTGKELFAESVHDASSRAAGPFVALSGLCSAVELAGQLADDGAFAQADGGTLVLDEVAELPLPAQARVLVLLARFADGVRVLSTTKRDLEREIEAGRLNEELFFRLSGARVDLPPLRHRDGDIALLAQHFWDLAHGSSAPALPPALLQQLHDYAWPGNVREFRHAIDRVVALGAEHLALSAATAPRGVGAGALPPVPRPDSAGAGTLAERLLGMDLSLSQARALLVADFELQYVEAALKRHGGNITRAAAASGLTRRYFHMLRAKQK